MCVAADLRPFNVMAGAFLAKNRRAKIAALSWMRLVPDATSNVARMSMMEMGLLGSKKLRFHLLFDFLHHDTVSS